MSALVEAFSRFVVQDVTLSLVRIALATRRRFGPSLWNSAIIAAARMLSCTEVLSEYLSPDRDYACLLYTSRCV